MEGLSGQDDLKTVFFRYLEQYKKGQKYLTADVNAVIEGLFDGGTDEVYVVDAHGSGSPKPDIIIEQIDPRAKFIHGNQIPNGKSLWEYYNFDAIAVVGMHSKTGGGGFMAHTNSMGIDYIVNERSVNETELLMYHVEEFNLPVIFASGDDKLKEQLQPYPWIEYVTVKFATSAYSADLRPIEDVHKEMRMSAKRAVENIPNAKVVEPKMPIKAGLRAMSPLSLIILKGVPGINYHDDTVTFEAKNYEEAWGGMNAIARVATRIENHRVLLETLEKQDNSKKIREEYLHNRFIRWLDIKSGQSKPPEK
jgi:D-amino peptidase